jgi:hypothetical protein
VVYLVSKGAKVDAVCKGGTTVVDMANGPRQRIQPYPETVAMLEMLGSGTVKSAFLVNPEGRKTVAPGDSGDSPGFGNVREFSPERA